MLNYHSNGSRLVAKRDFHHFLTFNFLSLKMMRMRSCWDGLLKMTMMWDSILSKLAREILLNMTSLMLWLQRRNLLLLLAALISSVKSKISKKGGGEEEGYIDGVLSINFINRSSSLIHQHWSHNVHKSFRSPPHLSSLVNEFPFDF